MTRRAYGTGGVTYDKDRDRWVATIETGWTARGTRRRKKITARTKREAQTRLRQALREASTSAPTAGAKPTVKGWAEEWLEIRTSSLRPTSWQTDRSQIVQWIIPTIGHKRLDRLTPGDRRAVSRAMEAAGRVPATVSRCDSILGKMLKDAVVEGHHVPLAVILTSAAGVGESDRNAIPLADALEILAASADLPDSSRWVAALLQGMRPAECLGLTWTNVDLDAGTVDVSWQLKPLPYRVPRDRSSGFRTPANYVTRQVDGALHLVRPKTAKGRRVFPLVPWMRSSLTAWREHCPTSRAGLVWPRADGRPRTDAEDRQAWFDLCDMAQVAHCEDDEGRRYALYEARHTTATLLREAGVDDETIKAILGHATILSTKAYLHTDSTRTRAALEKVAERLALN